MKNIDYKLPNEKETERILSGAYELNPGAWVEHSRYVSNIFTEIYRKESCR